MEVNNGGAGKCKKTTPPVRNLDGFSVSPNQGQVQYNEGQIGTEQGQTGANTGGFYPALRAIASHASLVHALTVVSDVPISAAVWITDSPSKNLSRSTSL